MLASGRDSAGETPAVSRPEAVAAGVRFGLATAAFATEGGYNGPGEPANNWSWWEAEGRVEPSGIALDFWHRYEHHLDRAAAAGCDTFALGVDWARCEPFEGQPDEPALNRYCRILDACHDRKLRPLVTFHHLCHPAWLGVDFWLRLDSPERFQRWVTLAADRFAGRVSNWVTLADANLYALNSYLTGRFPPGRRLDVAATIRAMDHMLAGHVLAYGTIKSRQPQSVVCTANRALSVYEVDRLLTDVLLSRQHGVGLQDLRPWLLERRTRYHTFFPPRTTGGLDRLLRRFARAAVPLHQALARAVAAVQESPCERLLDTVAFSYYDQGVQGSLRLGDGSRPEPSGLTNYARANAEPGLPISIVGHGLCNRVVNGRARPRPDGLTRVRHLKETFAALVACVDAGVPIRSYYHWTLADSYEWGSYQPRFGLHGIDRERWLPWSADDSMSGDAAGTYRRLITALRQGDRTALASPPGDDTARASGLSIPPEGHQPT